MADKKPRVLKIESEDIEKDSVYRNIGQFQKDLFDRRAREAVEEGKFATLEEAKENISIPAVMNAVKKIIMNRSGQDAANVCQIEAVNYIVTQIMNITPEQFWSVYSTENNKKYGLYIAINNIANNASNEVWKECAFDLKSVFFHEVWADSYSKYAEKITASDVYYCKDSMKSSLVRAGNTQGVSKGKKDHTYGKEVDDYLYDKLNDFLFDEKDFDNINDIFNFLAEDSRKYSAFHERATAPGICAVLDARGYSSLYDFFYLKLNASLQKRYAKEFLLIREERKLPHNELLEDAIKAFLEREKEKENA